MPFGFANKKWPVHTQCWQMLRSALGLTIGPPYDFGASFLSKSLALLLFFHCLAMLVQTVWQAEWKERENEPYAFDAFHVQEFFEPEEEQANTASDSIYIRNDPPAEATWLRHDSTLDRPMRPGFSADGAHSCRYTVSICTYLEPGLRK